MARTEIEQAEERLLDLCLAQEVKAIIVLVHAVDNRMTVGSNCQPEEAIAILGAALIEVANGATDIARGNAAILPPEVQH